MFAIMYINIQIIKNVIIPAIAQRLYFSSIK